MFVFIILCVSKLLKIYKRASSEKDTNETRLVKSYGYAAILSGMKKSYFNTVTSI